MGSRTIDESVGDLIMNKEGLTVTEFVMLAKKTRNHDSLQEAIDNHPSIDFEFIEMSGADSHS